MDYTNPIDLGIAEKLKKDESYRKAFFRANAADSIALQIRELRRIRDLKQAELAAAADMKQSAVSRIEQAKYSSWTFNTLLRIAEALNARLIIKFQKLEDAIREYQPAAASLAKTSSFLQLITHPNKYWSMAIRDSAGTDLVSDVGAQATSRTAIMRKFKTVSYGVERHV